MTGGLDPSTEQVVHRVWAERLGVAPRVLATPGPVAIDRPDLTAVVVVRHGETVAVAAPEAALSRLTRLAAPELLDVASLLAALTPLRPSLLGAASLSFGDRRTLVPVPAVAARAAPQSDVDAVVSRCSTEERDESGVLDVDMRWVVSGGGGEPAGVAGYEIWGDGLAHVGVAVAAGSRGQGVGSRVAAAAVKHAVGEGLVPQWRCRLDNVASARTGERLGLVRLGDQLAIDLARSDLEPTRAAG
ncbi:hypothetical protein Cph01nite_31960 [Cellulomonas phragmiteti]|uniref:N-acetyltransferase domain-containing protein n=2 Tax=Cellulomonas phragmiteti TaxID=478780 RepID=A0ABQ4DQ13_9CELL|nr:hypothetical protein Cph01nite_31960 [Cellulomonas phragmiteti]